MVALLTSPRVIVYILLTLSLALHLCWLAQPNEVVFDEVHNWKYVSGYLTGNYFFANHPPLGRLMIAGMARLTGFELTYSFRKIGQQYPNSQYIWLRLLPALLGSLLVPVVYLLALRLSHSSYTAAIAGLFVLLENALLVQSKFVLLDSFLLFFGFLSLYLFLQSRQFFTHGQWGGWAALGAAIAVGLCLATKWAGIGFWGLLLVCGCYSVVSKIWRGEQEPLCALLSYAVLMAVPLVLYVAVFFVHFALLPNPGTGNRFMTPQFLASQAAGYPLRDFPANLWELNRKMYVSHTRTTSKHPYGSRWYLWPLMWKPVYYWNKHIPAARGEMVSRRIYLLGNPIVWWTSTGFTAVFLLGLLLRLVMQASCRLFHQQRKQAIASEAKRIRSADALLAAGYLVNLLPVAGIGRVTFLYHYLASLIFSILIASVMLGYIHHGRKALLTALIVLTLAGFLAVSPLTFGTRLNDWPLWGSKEEGLLSLLLYREL